MSRNNKQWLGLPLHLIWGYIAIAVFMTGDGFELAFLSHYIKSLGFTPAEASFAFTLYGLAAALSAWVSGVVAEIITPQKTMLIGFVLWCVFHVLFLVFGLGQANYGLILLFYGIPSFTIPIMGEMGTLWLALAFCFAGGVIAMISLRHVKTPGHMHNLTPREKFAELSRAVTLLYTNRNIFLSSIVRIINTLSLFGFAVIMPMMFVDELGFTTSEWLQVWAAFFFTTIFSNIFWGIVAEKMGWMRVIRWFGCLGMAASSLAFYYMPQYFGHNYWMAMIPAIALGTFVAAFVPMAAVFPALEPKHKGAAISVYNLSAGMSNFLAPAIAVVLLPWFSTIGVVIAYTALYLLAFVLCAFIRVEQPGFSSAPVTEKALNIS